MNRSSCLSLATLSAALLLSLPATAHDPKQFDRMMDADEVKPEVSACTELDQLSEARTATPDASVKALQARCDAEKIAESKADSSHSKAAGKK